MADSPQEIRGIIAPMAECAILLPNNVVAEVIEWSEPDPVDHGPAWLLGELDWNDWHVPVISFARLCGASARDPQGGSSRILIIKTLSDTTSVLHIGLHINGLPKLTKIAPDSMETLDENPDSDCVFAKIRVDDREALIPELDELTAMVEQAVYSS